MANYNTLQDAIDAGISNMTSWGGAGDDNTYSHAIDVDWFKFNNSTVSTIWYSGNSWIGFTGSSEQFKVNRRDARNNSFYYESGKCEGVSFFKVRWVGTAYYGGSGPLGWELYIFKNDKMYVNYYLVPTSYFTNNNYLCSSNTTVQFDSASGVPCEYTFTATDSTHTSWTKESGKPELVDCRPHGENTEFYSTGETYWSFPLTGITNLKDNGIEWTQAIKEESSGNIDVYASLDNSTWSLCQNNASLPTAVVREGQDYTSDTLYIKIVMSTTNTLLTPVFSSLKVVLRNKNDDNYLLIELPTGNYNGFKNVVGEVTVNYVSGPLATEDNPVDAFTKSFTPTSLIPKENPNRNEHVEVNVGATGSLLVPLQVTTNNTENISCSLEITATLASV